MHGGDQSTIEAVDAEGVKMTNQSVGYREADINSIGSEDPEPDTAQNSITLKLS